MRQSDTSFQQGENCTAIYCACPITTHHASSTVTRRGPSAFQHSDSVLPIMGCRDCTPTLARIVRDFRTLCKHAEDPGTSQVRVRRPHSGPDQAQPYAAAGDWPNQARVSPADEAQRQTYRFPEPFARPRPRQSIAILRRSIAPFSNSATIASDHQL